jgi:hypothetical protein
MAMKSLGADRAPGEAWWGGGLWAGNGQGPSATLENSLGLGNGITGSGFSLKGGFGAGSWNVAGEVLGVREPDGGAHLTLYRSHVWWRGATGWQAGFEQEPLVWGFGLHGGYTLGESARPFPRLRVESPYHDISLLRVPLGAWGFQAFMGRLENQRVLSSSLQDLSWRQTMQASSGDPQAPLLNGYRVQARFGPKLEFYLNYLNLWSGTLKGVGMTEGYTWKDYLTAASGFKDTLAEASHDPNAPTVPADYKNKARSASEIDWGLRYEAGFLARAMGARKAWLSVARGSKSVIWPVGLFMGNPPRYLARDVKSDFNHLVDGTFGFGWNYPGRYSVPNLYTPNDVVGVLVDWPRVRLGLEYLDTVNATDQGHRSFAHGIYLSGFYYHGDPLGETLAGETRATTVRLETDLAPGVCLCTWLVSGQRPFRDELDLWLLDHRGSQPATDRILGVQERLACRLTRQTSLDVGAAWQRHGAVDYEAGRTGNGFRWFAELSFSWPPRG